MFLRKLSVLSFSNWTVLGRPTLNPIGGPTLCRASTKSCIRQTNATPGDLHGHNISYHNCMGLAKISGCKKYNSFHHLLSDTATDQKEHHNFMQHVCIETKLDAYISELQKENMSGHKFNLPFIPSNFVEEKEIEGMVHTPSPAVAKPLYILL